MQKEVESCPKSPCSYATLGPTGISEAGPHTANAPPQGSIFFTFIKKKRASIFFK